MKYILIFLILASISFTNYSFAQTPGNEGIISGNYTNKEFGFSVILPDSLDGFLAEIDNQSIGKIVNFQIHPEMEDSVCCPSMDTSPIVILFESHPKEYYSTPVPTTGDIYAAFQGYNMDIKIENLANMQVLTSTLSYEREYREFPEPIKRIGKFYFVNAGERYISYGILASEENYREYIERFENSAKSLNVVNATQINLGEMFPTNLQADLRLEDNSSIFPKITTPSNLHSIIADKTSKSLEISLMEPNEYRSFLILNIGDLLDGPYEIIFDDKQIEGKLLENSSGRYLVVFYSGQGLHDIVITGSSLNSITNLPSNIENIGGNLYHVSEPLELTSNSGKIIFHNVIFSPHVNEPPEPTYSFVTFNDRKKEALSIDTDEVVFSDNTNPQAGFVKRENGYHLLVSANLKEIPPLKQYKIGLYADEIQCKQNLLLIQKYDGSPACVTPEIVPKLLERGWVNSKLFSDNISKLIKSYWDKDSTFIPIKSANQIPANFNLQLPSYVPEGYSMVGYSNFGSESIGHVLIAPVGYQGKTGYDFWENNAIIIRYNANSNPAVDPMTSIKYQAKQNNVEPIDLGNNCTVFLQSSSVVYDDSLSTFIPVLPELTAHYDNVFVHISGNIDEKEILLLAESILDNKSVNSC